MELVANFTLNNEALDAQFNISEITNFDALFQIYATPTKVSELTNDLNFQTGEQVTESIQAASDVINNRIDGVVEAFDEDIENINSRMIDTVIGSDLIGVAREGNTVTLTSKTFVFEQGVASDTWVIVHNLNKNPSVALTDSAGTQFEARVVYDSLNQCTIYMNGATKGKAILN